jgi:outer membrane immunogenic protein
MSSRAISIVSGVALILAVSGSAFAADIARKMPVKAPPPPPAPVYSWTGFYVGLGAGGRWVQSDVTTTAVTVGGAPGILNGPPTQSFSTNSFRLSPYIGYDWQLAPQWVVGIEGEWGFANKSSTVRGMPWSPGFANSGDPRDTLALKTTWDASVLARAGYLITPTILGYVTAGPSWLHYSTTSTCLVSAGSCFAGAFTPNVITNSTSKLGWTLGAGIEAMLGAGWYARAEYRYADFGSQSFSFARTAPSVPITDIDNYTVKPTTHVVTLGLAYKFGERPWTGPP